MKLVNFCTNPGFLRLVLFLKIVLKIITIIIPIIIIVTIIMSVFKVVVSGKSDELKTLLPTFVKKILAGLIIFFLPSIITFVISLSGKTFEDLSLCSTNATIETINYYDDLMPVELKVQNAETNPTEANINAARQAIQKVTTTAREDDMVEFLRRLSEAEIKASEYKDIIECQQKGGTYNKGYCYIPIRPKKEENNNSNQNNSSSGDSDYTGNGSSGTISNSSLMDGSYKVIDTAISVKDYLRVISSNKISQNNDSDIYGGYCLAFAYLHAYSLYSGDTSKRAKDALDYVYASKFKGFEHDNKKEVLKNVYNELSNGRPCLIQVNGNKAGTSRHYVTVVGYKSSVKNANNLTEDDLLIIDSWDGKLEGLGSNGARFMVTGAACHKKYSGYQMYYLK